jgi:hypothetical protein
VRPPESTRKWVGRIIPHGNEKISTETCPVLRYYAGVCLEELVKPVKNSSRDSE